MTEEEMQVEFEDSVNKSAVIDGCFFELYDIFSKKIMAEEDPSEVEALLDDFLHFDMTCMLKNKNEMESHMYDLGRYHGFLTGKTVGERNGMLKGAIFGGLCVFVGTIIGEIIGRRQKRNV